MHTKCTGSAETGVKHLKGCPVVLLNKECAFESTAHPFWSNCAFILIGAHPLQEMCSTQAVLPTQSPPGTQPGDPEGCSLPVALMTVPNSSSFGTGEVRILPPVSRRSYQHTLLGRRLIGKCCAKVSRLALVSNSQVAVDSSQQLCLWSSLCSIAE